MTIHNEKREEDGIERVTISLERLQNNFIISMKEFIGKELPQEPAQVEEAEVDEPDIIEAMDIQEQPPTEEAKPKRKHKQAPKIEDYDIEDPFIDDSEVTAVYESVFDLMLRGDDAEEDMDSTLDVPEREHSTQTAKRPLSLKDFYVYRGSIEVEVVEKYHFLYDLKFHREFDEPKKKKKKKKPKKAAAHKEASSQTAAKQEATESEEVREPAAAKKRPKRKKPEELSSESLGSSLKKEKKETISLTERLQRLEAEIEEREGKAEDVKMADEPEEESKVGNVRRFYDIDKEVIRLEVLVAFERLKGVIGKVSDYDPMKFPTALRVPLERYIIACLHRDHDILEESVLQEVANLVPYSSAALRKLLLKKIFPLLIESLGQVRPEIIRARIREEIASILQSAPDEPDESTTDAAKKGKKRKWSEQLKQLVFEYLKCASERSLLLRSVRANSEEPNPRPIATSLSETALRRSAYRELVGCWPEDKWPITSGELSRECSAYKKKYERGLLKEHDVDIEQFLVVVEKPAEKASEPSTISAPVTSDPVGEQPNESTPQA